MIRARLATPAETVVACCHTRSVWRSGGVRWIVRVVLRPCTIPWSLTMACVRSPRLYAKRDRRRSPIVCNSGQQQARAPARQGQRGSCGRPPALASRTKRMRVASSEARGPAPPAPRTRINKQMLCHTGVNALTARAVCKQPLARLSKCHDYASWPVCWRCLAFIPPHARGHDAS